MAWSHADSFFRIELVGGQKTIGADWSDDYPYQVGPSVLAAVKRTDRKNIEIHCPFALV